MAGLLLAEAAVQYRCLRGQPPPASFGRAAYWVSGVANNLPDFDFLYSRITQPPTLGYLLHHRGHTHTLPVALLLAALLLGMVQLGLRRRQSELGHADWRWLWGLALLGSLAHIAMDFTNNYGVHPFWPLHNGWFYGDFVFIIEPLFFALGVPPLLASLRSPAMRVVFVLVLGAVLVLGWSMPWVPLLVAVVITFVALIALVLAFRLPPARRIAVAFASALLVVLVFGGTHLLAKKHALSSLPAASALQDLVLTPMPANPLCWSAWRVSSKAGTYVAERGVVASLPALLSAERCSVELGDGSRGRAGRARARELLCRRLHALGPRALLDRARRADRRRRPSLRPRPRDRVRRVRAARRCALPTLRARLDTAARRAAEGREVGHAPACHPANAGREG